MNLGVQRFAQAEISGWLREGLARPVKLECRDIPEQNKGAVRRQVLRESFAFGVDPRKNEEMQIGSLLEEVLIWRI